MLLWLSEFSVKLVTKVVTKFGVKFMKITSRAGINKAIKQSKETNKVVNGIISGYVGLSIRVRGDTVEFRHRYTHPILKNRICMTLGTYPAIDLDDAKNAHKENMALLAKNICPKEHRKQQKAKQANEYKYTVGYFINEVRADLHKSLKDDKLTKKTLTEKERYLKYIDAEFHQVLIRDITPPMLYEFFKKLQQRGKYVDLNTRSLFSTLYTKAIVRQIVTTNFVDAIKDALKTSKRNDVGRKHRPAIINPTDFGKLLNDIDAIGDTFDYIRECLQLLALLGCRIGDLCSMRWADIDFDNRLWYLTPQKKGKRNDMGDVVIPLPTQALAILERMHEKTGKTDYVFYTGTRKLSPYTDLQRLGDTLNADLPHGKFMNNGNGYQGIHCPHGFRSSARTMLREQLGYDDLLIELQIGHKMLNPHGRAYARMTLLAERTKMMQAWADYLDDLRAGKIDNIIYLHQAKKANTA